MSVSRTPLRQALVDLASDGVLEHVPNAGFFVKKFTVQQLSEVYAMRQCLETLLYESLDTNSLDMRHLESLEQQIEIAAEQVNIHTVTNLNRQLHWAIFDESPLGLVRDSVRRLWVMSDAYRTIYFVDGKARDLVIDEHRALLTALSDGDLAQAIAIADVHREGSRARVTSYIDY